jgi:hypothetical protein
VVPYPVKSPFCRRSSDRGRIPDCGDFCVRHCQFSARRGSMMTTPNPFDAAYCRPSVPACVSSSKKLYWIWQNV